MFQFLKTLVLFFVPVECAAILSLAGVEGRLSGTVVYSPKKDRTSDADLGLGALVTPSTSFLSN